jgi:MoaA/NifB/PqqE/SkfB family radical SAM enzyme
VESREEAVRVLTRILSWGPKSITFGGGDPLIHSWIDDLLAMVRNASSERIMIQLDTNGLKLSDKRLAELLPFVDLFGLPLDAVSEEVSYRMRAHRKHGELLAGLIPRAVVYGYRVKVNTVVTRVNIQEIIPIGEVVSRSGAHIWSLYEFWPINEYATKNSATYAVDHAAYDAVVKEAQERFPNLRVEGNGSVKSRHKSYFVVTPKGRAYTSSKEDMNKIAELGNVLSEEGAVLDRWSDYTDPAKNAGRIIGRSALPVL